MKEIQNKLKKVNGITLVALVVTVVILIILASITLKATFKDKGIINQAKKSTELYSNAEASDEKAKNKLIQELANAMYEPEEPEEIGEITIKENHTNKSITIEVEGGRDGLEYEYFVNGQSKAKQNERTYTENIILQNQSPYIPTGFEHKEGEINTGYVIKDINLGNEFVWIPVKSGTYTIHVIAKDENGNTAESNQLTIGISELTRDAIRSGDAYSDFEEVEGNISDKKSIAYFKDSVVKK